MKETKKIATAYFGFALIFIVGFFYHQTENLPIALMFTGAFGMLFSAGWFVLYLRDNN